jgi:hypothetical protein
MAGQRHNAHYEAPEAERRSIGERNVWQAQGYFGKFRSLLFSFIQTFFT